MNKPIRVLLVEDDPDRHANFTAWLPPKFRLVWARSGGAALAVLERDESNTYSGVMLDFDLTKRQHTAADVFTDGGVVARGVLTKVDSETPVLVHSMNPTGATHMVSRLQEAGFPVTRISYEDMTKDRFLEWLAVVDEYHRDTVEV